MSTIPSLETLVDAFGQDKAAELHFALTCEDVRDLRVRYASADRYAQGCYFAFDDAIRLHACDQILEGHGIDGWVDPRAVRFGVSYVNTGDAYATTILLDSETEAFVVASYGDYLEAWEERKGYTVDGVPLDGGEPFCPNDLAEDE